MAIFRICISTAIPPLVVDLAANNIQELAYEAATSRFLAGSMAVPDQDGCYAPVMIQTSRIQCAFETQIDPIVLYG